MTKRSWKKCRASSVWATSNLQRGDRMRTRTRFVCLFPPQRWCQRGLDFWGLAEFPQGSTDLGPTWSNKIKGFQFARRRDLSKRLLRNTCYWCGVLRWRSCHVPSSLTGSPLHLHFTSDLALILQSWDRWLRFFLALFRLREAWTYGPCYCVLGNQTGLVLIPS